MDSITQYLNFPIQDPTWVFFIVLLIILFAPLLFHKLHIPHIIGMILAGVILGENGFNILERDGSFKIFGQVGIYYIMFLAGIEMDLVGLKRNINKGLLFGVITSLIPFACGLGAGYYLLDYSFSASLLLACIFASHTIVAYPIVARYGLNKHSAVTISISATMIALLFALLTLAVIASRYRGGGGLWFWVLFVVKCIAYFSGLFWLFPIIIRWFFRRYTDRVLQYIFVIAMMFLAAGTANLCGIEGLLGAFLSGLIFNRFIPHMSSLMNRIEFVGNALFIPYFLVGVGMLVNLKPIFTDMGAIVVVVIMVVVSTLSKLMASFITRKILHLPHSHGLVMFGLSEAHAAGAIAMVMVGTSLMVAPGEPLMNTAVLDGVVMMILLSCIISSIATDKGARKLKLESDRETSQLTEKGDDEKIMVLVKESAKIRNLTQTAIMMRNPDLNRGLICLNVVNDADPTEKSRRMSREILEQAEEICSANDVPVQVQSRLAVNLVNGVVHALRENDASEMILGLHEPRQHDTSYYGQFTEALVQSMNRQVMVVHYHQPVNTIGKIVVAVPDRAEYETGFYRWVERVLRLAGQIGCKIVFYSSETTGRLIYQYSQTHHKSVRTDFKLMESLTEVYSLRQVIHHDHMLVIVAARPSSLSYQRAFARLPKLLHDHFNDCSLMLIYPDQFGENNSETTFTEPHGNTTFEMSKTSAWLSKWLSKI
ncbi:MAG: cation:proton antiporter [Bacteroidaceae bacterium]|nr:cation:proton antiporter [Bacteroidaceae bacterium]